jgi:hypothetical protein
MIVEPDIRDHYKTEQLARALGINGDAVVVLLIRMWGYCQLRKSSALPADPLALAAICRYPSSKRASKREADRLRDSLISIKWVDEIQDGLEAHGWVDHNKKWLARVWATKNQGRSERGRFGRTSGTVNGTVDGAVADSHTGGEERRGEEITNPIVPFPSEPAPPGSLVRGNPEFEKKRMCALFGADPSRPIGYEAEHAISRISPIPEDEWIAVEWLHHQPDDPCRPQPRMSVGTLAANWQDEVAKARRYAERCGTSLSPNSAKKKEGGPPSEWPAFLQAQGFPSLPWAEAERSLRNEFQTWLNNKTPSSKFQ